MESMNSIEPLIYDLKNHSGDSGPFYTKLASFSKEVYTEIKSKVGTVIDEYLDFVQTKGIETPRSKQEYSIELLTLAMAWLRYLGASQKISNFLLRLQTGLFKLRKMGGFIKRVVDPIRGLLSGSFMVPAIGSAPRNSEISFENLQKLILWLTASGEFTDEVRRFNKWGRYFAEKTADYFKQSMGKALELAGWFKNKAEEVLGRYTAGVSRFHKDKYSRYRFREDEIFCGKEEVEYHINMVASRIINLGYREEFLKTPKRGVLIPGCMRINGGRSCKARHENLVLRCTGCNKECNVNKLREAGVKHNFDLYIILHSSNSQQWIKAFAGTKEYGMVAAACLLNIVVGGYTMRSLNIPSQCVLLDHPGCKKHWSRKGIDTNLNLEHLVDVVEHGV